jgi:hypothetical protein
MTTEWGDPPADLAGLDVRLARLEFAPRASLAPEIEGRTRHPGPGRPSFRPGRRWVAAGVATAASIAVIVAAGLVNLRRSTVVDRCCADLDGGGRADDGVRVLVGHAGQVRRVSVYEDRDGSRGLTATDTVRYSGAGDRQLPLRMPPGFQATRHCCADYDGGGVPDDGVLVLELPPDRVLMAVVYEQGRAATESPR